MITTINAVQNKQWDLIVIGAGPAGSLIARNASLAGVSVLIVDKSKFPRYKVCGCCLSKLALNLLKEAGLKEKFDQLNSVSINKLLLANNGSIAQIEIATGVAISRQEFDWFLLSEALQAGADFLPDTYATVQEMHDGDDVVRSVQLQNDKQSITIQSKIVVSADGLSGTSLRHIPEFNRKVLSSARVGAGAILSIVPDYYAPGVIYMAVAKGGYVGQVRIENGQLDIAAAFDQAFLRECGSPAVAARVIIEKAGFPVKQNFDNAEWKGTMAFTSYRTKVSAERLFVVGDAAGYAEPFTGEGIVWALKSALLVSDLVLRGINNWSPQLNNMWDYLYNKHIRKQQNKSFQIALLLRQDPLVRLATRTLSAFPWLANPVVRNLNVS